MNDIDLDALEATARAATPGPWELDGMGEDEPEINYWAHLFIGTVNPNESGSHEIIATSEDRHGPNAKHIAAFDPPTVLTLITRLREAEDAESRLNLLLDGQTGGRLSYTTYPVAVMSQEIDAYHERLTEEDRAEYRAIADEALARLREAEACIEAVGDYADDAVHVKGIQTRLRQIISRYKTTKTEGSER